MQDRWMKIYNLKINLLQPVAGEMTEGDRVELGAMAAETGKKEIGP